MWEAAPPTAPIIAAGSTGSIPAAADLMHTIARLPRGAVYLPGLDRAPSDEDWLAIGEDPSHPQYGLAHLLTRFEMTRDQVMDVEVAAPTDLRQTRAEIVSAALLPAERTHGWKERAETMLPLAVGAAMASVTRIDCQSEREEAQVIALALRRFIAEHEDGVAALVTPDRTLARRVAGELKRWRIEIDNSAGQPLSQTAPGAYLLALCDAAANDVGADPVCWRCSSIRSRPPGERAIACDDAARRLDRAVLRGPRPAPGWDGLRQAIDATHARRSSHPEGRCRREADADHRRAGARDRADGELDREAAAGRALARGRHSGGSTGRDR